MAIDEADSADSGQIGGSEGSDGAVGTEASVETEERVAVGRYTWADFMDDQGYSGEVPDFTGDGSAETADVGLTSGDAGAFDPSEFLSFSPADPEGGVAEAADVARRLESVVDQRTVDVREEVEEDEFFSDEHGNTTVTNRYDLEKAVPMEKKTHFREEQRYWVNKPYSFVIIFHSRKENEKKYYAVEPHLNEIEEDLREFLIRKLRTAIKYADEDVAAGGDSTEAERRAVIERETKKLLDRYDLFAGGTATHSGDGSGGGFFSGISGMFGGGEDEEAMESAEGEVTHGRLSGIETRPEPRILHDNPRTLTEYQIEKLLYLLKRDFIGYERIDPIKHDINVEDISCDGYNSPVFVYHTDYEQIISNIYHGESELDDFVVKLAQRSGKGISKRRPQVDATLPDGSRAQLTLGREVSDHGTNYTIRQFKDVPFTPIDLINWNTFSLDQMAFLWLCIENHKSLIFAGGTASGKTTSLNAVSLFIPSNTKIVSIEDTREVELPQRNWVASVTRPSFSDDDQGDVDEFDLLEAALRQRPDYIVFGEVRGEEGRDLFQVMSTGHTSYSTFHADTVGEVLKRFTTDPINVSKTMFTALDLVSIQTQTRVHGHKVRRNKTLTEVNHYDAENDEINVQDVYQWQAETDEFLKLGDSNTLEEIKFDRGWNQDRLEEELFKRRIILAYLIKNSLNEYREVAATVQAFINDPDTILTLIANGKLEESLGDLREMESVLIDVDPAKEALVPRPDPDDEGYNLATSILEQAEESLFEDYRGRTVEGLDSALEGVTEAEAEPTIGPDDVDEEISFEGEVAEGFETDFTFGGGDGPFADDEDAAEAGEGASADEEPEEDPFSGGPDWLGGGEEETTEDIWAEAREALEEGVAEDEDRSEQSDDEPLPEDTEADADDEPPELEGSAGPATEPEPSRSGTTEPSGDDAEAEADTPTGEGPAATSEEATSGSEAETTEDEATPAESEEGGSGPEPEAASGGNTPVAAEDETSTTSEPDQPEADESPQTPSDDDDGSPFSESSDEDPFGGGEGGGGPFSDDEPLDEEDSPFEDGGPFSSDGPFGDDETEGGDDEDE